MRSYESGYEPSLSRKIRSGMILMYINESRFMIALFLEWIVEKG
jgi:hypothetical protein